MEANGTSDIRQVDQSSSKTDSSEKGKTTPPLNFRAILKDAGIPIDMSYRDKLCDLLYAGVYLTPNELMYFVDKKTNKNCFMLFPRKLDICWSNNSNYWDWTKEVISGEEIEMAELLEVCWLDIRGKFTGTIDLSPGAMYEIVFVVKMKDGNGDDTNISNYQVTLTMTLPRSRTQTRNESLKGKPKGWFDILVGEFIMSPENVGNIEFSMEEHSSWWKSGLIVKCAIIRPKEEKEE